MSDHPLTQRVRQRLSDELYGGWALPANVTEVLAVLDEELVKQDKRILRRLTDLTDSLTAVPRCYHCSAPVENDGDQCEKCRRSR